MFILILVFTLFFLLYLDKIFFPSCDKAKTKETKFPQKDTDLETIISRREKTIEEKNIVITAQKEIIEKQEQIIAIQQKDFEKQKQDYMHEMNSKIGKLNEKIHQLEIQQKIIPVVENSHQPFRPSEYKIKRSCENKLIYNSEDEADIAAENFWNEKGTVLKSYNCQYCGNWHLATDKG